MLANVLGDVGGIYRRLKASTSSSGYDLEQAVSQRVERRLTGATKVQEAPEDARADTHVDDHPSRLKVRIEISKLSLQNEVMDRKCDAAQNHNREQHEVNGDAIIGCN